VLFLRRGRLVEDAPAPAFFEGPATREARAFLAGELDW
jgi:tungstate transport system ATP-binding protein